MIKRKRIKMGYKTKIFLQYIINLPEGTYKFDNNELKNDDE